MYDSRTGDQAMMHSQHLEVEAHIHVNRAAAGGKSSNRWEAKSSQTYRSRYSSDAAPAARMGQAPDSRHQYTSQPSWGSQQVPPGRLANLIVVYSLILGHMLLSAFTEPLHAPQIYAHLIVTSVQLFLLLALFMALFTLTSSAEVVALGLYDDYLRRHRWLYGAALLALATYTAHRAFSLVLVFQQVPEMERWQQPGFWPLWIIQRLALLAFYCVAGWQATLALDPSRQLGSYAAPFLAAPAAGGRSAARQRASG